VDENSRLILKDFKMEIEFAGRLKWYGKQGRLKYTTMKVEKPDMLFLSKLELKNQNWEKEQIHRSR